MRAKPVMALTAALVFTLGGCSKSTPPQKETLNPLNRADSTRVKPVHFLHKTFPVKKYVQLEFEVPIHSVIPRLRGTFKSFVRRPGDDDRSDESADVDFLLMESEQFSDFSHGQGDGTALYSVDPTHDQEVEFLLPPTQDEPKKYYLVFRNSPGGAAVKYVAADFSLTFGY